MADEKTPKTTPMQWAQYILGAAVLCFLVYGSVILNRSIEWYWVVTAGALAGAPIDKEIDRVFRK